MNREVVLDYTVNLPEEDLHQTEEYVYVKYENGEKEKVLLHDYDKMYAIPGLYEKVIYDILNCASHEHMADKVKEHIPKDSVEVLEIGAGNGVFGEALANVVDIEHFTGVDISEIAKVAVKRDRPHLYNDYYIEDITDLPENLHKKFIENEYDVLVVPSATGFGHLPIKAFKDAGDLLPVGALIVFNIRNNFVKDFFIKEGDDYILKDEYMREKYSIEDIEAYFHRDAIGEGDYYYSSVVLKKIK